MICPVTPLDAMLFEQRGAFMPLSGVGSWDWICEHGRMPDGTPFDGGRIPWCKGICDAWDDPETREISLQWGTRLGKTTIGLQLMAKSAATKPRPGLFATSTQSLAERTVDGKIYKILDHIPETAAQLPPPRWRTKKEIKLSNSSWYVAWSGSDTQLADLSAFYGYGNEIDKWSRNERQGGDAGEGDSLEQFLERFKEFHNAKILLECSPSTKRLSRIESRLLQSNNCRYQVPCPKCGTHQALKLGKEGEPGGIRFDRLPDGSSDPAFARDTARYVCEHCEYEIGNELRPRMMRAGVWCPEGCSVNKRGRVVGTPKRGPRLWGGQLSSLYSLQMSWGEIAEKFVASKDDAKKMQMFVNGWLAETWEPYRSKTEPEQVGQKLTVSTPRGVIPLGCTWLFAAIDRQIDHYVYWVEACGPNDVTHLVDHGTTEDKEFLEHHVIRRKFEHEDGGEPLAPFRTLVDCGFRAKEMYQFCQRFKKTGHWVMPVKGANTDLGGKPFTDTLISARAKNQRMAKAMVKYGLGLTRYRCSPYYYEPIIQDQLENLSPGETGCFTMHEECVNDIDLLRQICNGAESNEPSKMDPDRFIWVKRWSNEPNDYRDCKKYARCAMDIAFSGGRYRVEKRQKTPGVTAAPRPVEEKQPEGVSRRRSRMRERRVREPRERRRR